MRTPTGMLEPALAAAGLAVVAVLALLVVTDLTDPVDAAILTAVRSPDAAPILSPLRQITELGSTAAVIVVATMTLALAVAIGPWLHGVAGALTIALAALLNATAKVVIARERPELLEPLVDERGFSFPSGHAALGMVAYGILAVVVGRSRLPRPLRVGLIAALLVLVGLIGLSRVWLGVHYPSDVLAGWIVGASIVALYRWGTRRLSREPAEVAVDVEATPDGAAGRQGEPTYHRPHE